MSYLGLQKVGDFTSRHFISLLAGKLCTAWMRSSLCLTQMHTTLNKQSLKKES